MNNKNLIIGVVVLAVVFGGIFLFAGNNSPKTDNVVSDTSLTGNSEKVTIYFFWGDGCPHCAREKPFLEELEKKYGDKIEIKMFETWKNQENANLFQETASAYGIQAQGVPTTFIGDKNWVGYADYMKAEIEDYVKYCIENKCKSPLETDCGEEEEEEEFCTFN